MTFTVGIPQLLWIVIVVVGVTNEAIHHGELGTKEYNFYYRFIAELLVIGLLYWGGFFG